MANKTGNPALWLPSGTEYSRLAKEGMIAEWNMLTYSGGNAKLLLDQSGNGYDALFTATQTVNAEGVTFNGTYYADATLPVLTRNYTYFCVVKSASNGYYLFGSYSASANRGSSIRLGMFGPNTICQVFHGSSGNIANGPTVNSSTYCAVIVKMSDDNQARVKSLRNGITGYCNSLRGEDYGAEDRTKWRIGGAMTTADAIHLPLDTGTVAYCGVYNRVTTEKQDAALLKYLQEKMALRSVSITL